MSSFAAKNSRCFKCYALIKSTKSLIQKLREDGWNTLIEKVTLFCEKNDIEIPDMTFNYKAD